VLRTYYFSFFNIFLRTFLTILCNTGKFDLNKNFKTWVFTVAANLCKNSFRNKGKNISFEELSNVQKANPVSNLNTIDKQSFKQELALKLNQMPVVYKEVFILKYHEGLSLKEIATIANCPLATVKSRLHSALGILAKKLTHYQPSVYEI